MYLWDDEFQICRFMHCMHNSALIYASSICVTHAHIAQIMTSPSQTIITTHAIMLKPEMDGSNESTIIRFVN